MAASLSHVEARRVANDYTIQFGGIHYQIARTSMRDGLRANQVRVEARLDGSIAVRFQGDYLDVTRCGTEPAQVLARVYATPVGKITIAADGVPG